MLYGVFGRARELATLPQTRHPSRLGRGTPFPLDAYGETPNQNS